jgi:hypothetical protein
MKSRLMLLADDWDGVSTPNPVTCQYSVMTSRAGNAAMQLERIEARPARSS